MKEPTMASATGTLSDTRYWEYNNGEVAADSPIVLVLHWMSGNADSMRDLFDDISHPLRVLFLQGRHPSGDLKGSFSWFPDHQNFYNLPFADQAHDIKSEAARIAAFLRSYRQTHPARDTIVVGRSQGGDLALALATEHPELLTLAVACGARALPRLVQRPRDVRKPRILMLHGTDDTDVPVNGAREDMKRLRSVGYDVILNEYPGIDHCKVPDIAEVVRQEVEQLG
jgi:predicted esterase